jgi:predicted flap endonuclease-1-like 5' DNA nuclease
MVEIASQILLCLLIAALLGFIVGYLLGRSSCSKDIECEAPVSHHHKDEESGVKPSFLSEPREGKKDNLQLIKGVGAMIEHKLNELGVYHFDQIASWGKSEMNWIDNYLSFQGRAKREKWVEQAEALAKGEMSEFAQRVQRGEVPTSHI